MDNDDKFRFLCLYIPMVTLLIIIGISQVPYFIDYVKVEYRLFYIYVCFMLSTLVIWVLEHFSTMADRYYRKEFREIFSVMNDDEHKVDEFAVTSKFNRNKMISFGKYDENKYIKYMNTYAAVTNITKYIIVIIYVVIFLWQLWQNYITR